MDHILDGHIYNWNVPNSWIFHDLISGSKLFSVATSTGKASFFFCGDRGRFWCLELGNPGKIKMKIESCEIIELNPWPPPLIRGKNQTLTKNGYTLTIYN